MSEGYGITNDLRYYEFELDSNSSFSPYATGYTKQNWPLFQIGGKRPLQTIAAIKILEFQCPFTWYVFTATNGTFVLQETGQVPVDVVIPESNYTMAQFLPVLASLLTAASLSGFTYTCVYDSGTQKIAIYNNNATTLPFSLVMSGDEPARFIGFPEDSTTTSQTFIAVGPVNHGNVLVTPNVVNISGPNYLYVNSTTLGTLVDLYLPVSDGGNSGPQICKIPVNQNSGGIIDWIDPDPSKWFNMEGLNQLYELDFFLSLGDKRKVVDLNGQSFFVKLGVLERTAHRTITSAGSKHDRSVKRFRRE